jgi:regulatory protein
MRREYGVSIVDGVLEELARLGYINDATFARTKALSAAQHKQHGRRRAFMELLKSGVTGEVAGRAVEDVYETHDSLAIARQLAIKQAPRLRRLDPLVARRRLVGMLQRRGRRLARCSPTAAGRPRRIFHLETTEDAKRTS